MAKVGPATMTTEPLFRQLMPKTRPYYATPYEETLAYLERLGRRSAQRSSPQCQETRLRSLEAQVQNLRDQLRETSFGWVIPRPRMNDYVTSTTAAR
ncbi:hypothetical protein OSTOST_09430 [Ostertagia ostertagi]